MSAPTKRQSWLSMVTAWAALSSSFYGWKVCGIEGAGNLFLFWAWLTVITGLIAYLDTTKPDETIRLQSAAQSAAINSFTIALMLALAWFGHFVLATFWLIRRAARVLYRERFDADGKVKVAG